MRQKYVNVPTAGGPSIIIFPQHIRHDTFEHLKPTSAGFVDFYIDDHAIQVKCFGRSDSLNLEANEEKDSALATREFAFRLY